MQYSSQDARLNPPSGGIKGTRQINVRLAKIKITVSNRPYVIQTTPVIRIQLGPRLCCCLSPPLDSVSGLG